VQKSGLSLANSVHDGVTVVRIGGFLDGHTIINLERHIDGLAKVANQRLVFELSELTYIASAGVGLFINVSHRLKGLGGRLELVKPSPSVAEIFAILGLDSIFTIHPDLATGIAAARG
jgi:anti-sigma B factor antagonist